MSLLRLHRNRRAITAGLFTPLLVFLAVFTTVGIKEMTRPEPAKAVLGVDIGIPGVPSPCDLVPNHTGKKVCEGVTDPVGTVAGAVGLPDPAGIVKKAVDTVTRTLAEQFVQLEAEAVGYSLKSMVTFVNTITTPDLAAQWFVDQYRLLLAEVGILAVMMFFIRGYKASRRRDAKDAVSGGFSFAGFLYLSSAWPFIQAAIVVFFDDVLAYGWLKLFGNNTQHALDNISKKLVDVTAGSGNFAFPTLIMMVILAFGVAGSVVLFVQMIYRLQVLFLLTMAQMFAFALNVGGGWGTDAMRKITMLNVAFTTVKFVVVVALTVSIGFIANAPSWQAALVGSISLFMVGVIFIWWIHFVGQYKENINGKLIALVAFATKKVK